MSIPDRFNPLGVSTSLPAGVTSLAYLESTGSQYMVTDFIPSNDSGIHVDCQMLSSADTIPCGCRNSAPEYTRFYAIRPPLLSNWGAYLAGYGWGAWKSIEDTAGYYRDQTYLNWRNNRLAQCRAGRQELENLTFTPIYPAYIFAANVKTVPSNLFVGKIWRVVFSQEMRIVHDFVPAITSDGTPCMYDVVNKMYVVNSGGGALICGIETLSQLNDMLHNLPDASEQETRILTIRLAEELKSQTIMNHIDSVSLIKNWNIALAA